MSKLNLSGGRELRARFYILTKEGHILDGPYTCREDADTDAERYRYEYGTFAFAGTLDEWNSYRRRSTSAAR